MRLSILDILVLGSLFAAGGVAGAVACHLTALTSIQSFAAMSGAFVALVCGSPVYRLLRMRPMLLPKCPRCHARPESYRVAGDWPLESLTCGVCNGNVRAWYGPGRLPAEIKDGGEPVLRAAWPYWVGRWTVAHES